MDFSMPSMDAPVVWRLVVTFVIIVSAYVLARIGQRMAVRYLKDATSQYRASKWIERSIAVTAMVIILVLWSPGASDLFTVLTIIGAGLAVALRDVLLSFVGWFRLSFNSPYVQGDRIEVNGIRGDVIDIGTLQTALMEIGEWVEASQSTGRIVHIPNSWIFQYCVKNYTDGFNYLWHEFAVIVTYQSDWQAARDIMMAIADEVAPHVEEEAAQQLRGMSKAYLVRQGVLTPYVYMELAPHGIKLTMRHLTPARGRRNIRHELTAAVLARFQEHGHIQIAYPTYAVAPSSDKVFSAFEGGDSAPPHGNGQ